MSFISIMKAIGRDCLRALADVVLILPPAEKIAALFFPAEVAALGGVITSVDLIQKAVAQTEQKFAAAGKVDGTGELKFADVFTFVRPIVLKLLAAEKVVVTDERLTKIINAIVSILNANDAPPALISPAA
jgi:hypothetical protein